MSQLLDELREALRDPTPDRFVSVLMNIVDLRNRQARERKEAFKKLFAGTPLEVSVDDPESEPATQEPEEPEEPEEPMTAQPAVTTPPPSIVRTGQQLILPEGMDYKSAIDLITRRAEYEQKVTQVFEQFDVFPLDGAHALFQVLTARYGWVEGVPTPGFFGDTPPALISVRVDLNRSVSVPWGDIRLPNVAGIISIGASKKDGRVIFSLLAKIRRQDEPTVRAIFDEVKEYLRTHSIYQGKAIAVRFFDDEGQKLEMPEPTFMDTHVDPESLIFSADMERLVKTNLFTPIVRHADLKANGIPLKRGVLLAGTYGTGKTLSAKLASKLAVEAGITFIYVRRAEELAHSIQFARQYSEPAVVVFCEDIDSVTDGERDTDLNDILNTIDGVDTKGMNLITLLTTNHVDRITTAMLRPGRLDAVIEVPPPDKEARVKLLRYYGNGAIPKNADLSTVADELDGAIPAVIAEVVKRAKLHQLALQKPGTPIKELSPAALLDSAKTIAGQRKLLELAEKREALVVEGEE